MAIPVVYNLRSVKERWSSPLALDVNCFPSATRISSPQASNRASIVSPFACRTRDLELEEEVVEPETSVRQLHHVQLDREKLLIGQSPEGGRPTRSGSPGGRESERTG